MIEKKKTKKGKFKIKVKFNENISKEEEQAIWNNVFDILLKKKESRHEIHCKSDINNVI